MTDSTDLPEAPPPADALAATAEAGLRYVSDRQPGIRRRRVGRSFVYRDPAGQRLHDPAALERIRRLAVPPAWQDVWICSTPQGHIQATGRDQRGRKQYRYHPRWREVRDADKFNRMLDFGAALPRIRRRVARDLARRGLSHDKVVAAIVRLLEITLIRIGNEEYARANHSYGLTTLRDQHVDIKGGAMAFQFRAKSGRMHRLTLRNRRLARIVKSCQDIPGQELFQYVDDAGMPQPVGSADVNDYLRRITGQDFSAKDFRTWAGTVLAATALTETAAVASPRQSAVAAVRQVAERLGNTPAVCRRCYIHPAILEAHATGELSLTPDGGARRRPAGLQPVEAAVLEFLRQRRRRDLKGRLRQAARASRRRRG